MPEMLAVQKWLDNNAEIRLKKAIEQMMRNQRILALIIRSLSLKTISALKDLGLSGDAEVDLVMAYVSGDFLHVVICEVKSMADKEVNFLESPKSAGGCVGSADYDPFPYNVMGIFLTPRNHCPRRH